MFFSHTAGSLGIGHVTEGRAVAFVASASTDLPTSPPYDFSFCVLLNVWFNFVVLLGYDMYTFFEFKIKVRLRRSAWHGYQLFVRN